MGMRKTKIEVLGQKLS